MQEKKPTFLEQYKELGLVVTYETKVSVTALCPFHGDKKQSQLLVSKENGYHRCFEKACVAFTPGDIDDYADLLFGKAPTRKKTPNGAGIAEAHLAKAKDELDKALNLDPSEVDLAASSADKWIGKRVKFKATSAGKALDPYAAPKKIRFTCNMGLRICGACSIGNAGGTLIHDVPGDSMDVLRMIDVNEEQQKIFMSKAVKVPLKCMRFDFKVEEHYAVEDIRLMPEISFNSNPEVEYVMKQAYHVGHGVKTNQTYEFEGIPVPDPKDQHHTYILDKAKPVQDSIESFKLTEEEYEQLKMFQVETTVEDKLRDIAADLSNNITRIYERNDLISAVDLVYHSVLRFKFRKQVITKGWVEGLIIGDTRCGKTETVTRLIQHYRAGEISTGENCSFAGLVGGLQQIGSRWTITWGKLPLNDKRLFVLDEISGMPVEDIGKMSGIRSSGVAEITKVQSEKTFARTRLLWVGNPRSTRPLGSYDTGVQAIPELIGRPEDIARFDLAIAVMSGDVPLSVVNRAKHEVVEHKYTSDLCNKLVMWAWSRKADNVRITPEAEELCLELSMTMGTMYSSAIPLVEPAEFRIKLIRLAVACAARLFSTSDGNDLVVDIQHVRFVFDFLNKIYAASSLNYLSFSKAKLLEQQLKSEEVVSIIVKSHGPTLVEGLLSQQYFRLQDFEDLFDLEKKELKGIISQLVRNRAVKHYNTGYVKTPAFITLLRKIQVEGVAELPKPAEVEY